MEEFDFDIWEINDGHDSHHGIILTHNLPDERFLIRISRWFIMFSRTSW